MVDRIYVDSGIFIWRILLPIKAHIELLGTINFICIFKGIDKRFRCLLPTPMIKKKCYAKPILKL